MPYGIIPHVLSSPCAMPIRMGGHISPSHMITWLIPDLGCLDYVIRTGNLGIYLLVFPLCLSNLPVATNRVRTQIQAFTPRKFWQFIGCRHMQILVFLFYFSTNTCISRFVAKFTNQFWVSFNHFLQRKFWQFVGYSAYAKFLTLTVD